MILICFNGISQPLVNRAGPANTVQDARLSTLYNFNVPSYVDSNAANLQLGLGLVGSLFWSTSDSSLYARHKSLYGAFWFKIGGSGGGATGSFWSLTGNLFPVVLADYGLGTNDETNLPLKTNNIQRVILPYTGLALLNDTANTKVMTFNPSSKEWGYSSWNNGGTNIYNTDGTQTVPKRNYYGLKTDTLNLDSVNLQLYDNRPYYTAPIAGTFTQRNIYTSNGGEFKRVQNGQWMSNYFIGTNYHDSASSPPLASFGGQSWYDNGNLAHIMGYHNAYNDGHFFLADFTNTSPDGNNKYLNRVLTVEHLGQPFVVFANNAINNNPQVTFGKFPSWYQTGFETYGFVNGKKFMQVDTSYFMGKNGFGTALPTTNVHINAAAGFRYVDGFEGVGKVLQDDGTGTGVAKWVSSASASTNIYNSDGTLTGNRIVRGSGTRSLNFNNINGVVIDTGKLVVRTSDGFDPVADSAFSVFDGGMHTNRGVRHENLPNLSTQDRLLGQLNSTGQVGNITIGSGLSLAGGALSATGSVTPAGNYGNVQLNRNSAFATPASDSLDFESATGLTVKGNITSTENLFLKSSGKIDFGSGLQTITHSGASKLTIQTSGADDTVQILTAGSNRAVFIVDAPSYAAEIGTKASGTGVKLGSYSGSSGVEFTGTGYFSNSTNQLNFLTTASVFNQNSGDIDFHIKGDTEDNVLYVDASANSVGIGIATPAASAKLDITSTTKGVLFPRMTTTQKNAISSPAEGLVLYDTDLKKLCVYTGSAWETITSLSLGLLVLLCLLPTLLFKRKMFYSSLNSHFI